MDPSDREVRWIAALMPYSVAVGPLSTLITLEIASLRGGPIDVGYAMSAGSAAGIIAPLLWGFLLDRYSSRRILTLGFLGTALFILVLAHAPSIPQIALYYASSSLFSSAVGVSMSFILVKSSGKLKLNESYSVLNFISSLGYLIGDVSAAVLSSFMDIKDILLIMGLLPITSFIWSLMKVPQVTGGAKTTMSGQVIKGQTREVSLGELIVLYVALTIFYFSSGIFNTLYPYGLRVGGLSKSWVMAIISVGMGIQIIGFMVTPRMIRILGGNAKASSNSLVLRGLSYFLIGLTASTPESMIITGLTLYPLAAGVAYSTFYTASSVMVFERLRNGEEGRGLGVYNLITGSAYLSGSLVSGYLANSISIGRSYMVAGAMLWISAYLFREIDRKRQTTGLIKTKIH
ncbi:MFS transporter [Vulcanisaeta souniana]|uniref:MFS transporter n=1 Tax=Vulcanisaeta souniana JCM 11219 TaxID=1293586 RepID=A0A830EG67_9CREN|nr:MFS transporter [Vulcanisaeta souniana]BDR90971.1 MFS transporter [Vulcanisaeta souniana JCM 11219]GGI79709.1 MFS transporter [Vulcanisaeta souniana JCM 11219]